MVPIPRNIEYKKTSSLYTHSIHTCGGGLVTKSCPSLLTPWPTVYQAPLSMGFPRQEYWSGLPFPSPLIHNLHHKKLPKLSIFELQK